MVIWAVCPVMLRLDRWRVDVAEGLGSGLPLGISAVPANNRCVLSSARTVRPLFLPVGLWLYL